MDSLFPLNLPSPTAWYVLLYLATLLMHVVFMSYVLIGALLLGAAGLGGLLGRGPQASAFAPLVIVLKDWMPFALSAAITAGVAPLLFVQILYQREFYTANLLSFHRWMAILPVLIVAFYLLYVLKADRIAGKAVLQAGVALLVAACMLFVAWSWIENHLLALNRAAWPGQYESGAMLYADSAILPRLGFWIAGAVPLAGALLGWQLRAGASGTEPSAVARTARPLAAAALAFTVIGALVAWPVLRVPALSAAGPVSGTLPWFGLGVAGATLTAIGWIGVIVRGVIERGALLAATIGSIGAWAGALALRESVRWSVVGGADISARHAEVGTVAGLVVFLSFAVLGIGTVAWVVRSVARTTRAARALGSQAAGRGRVRARPDL